MRRWLLSLAIPALASCEPAAVPQAVNDGVCDPPEARVALPAELDETSGLAASRIHPGVYWTHNDSGGEAMVYAVDTAGAVVGRVRVRGAVNRDWEDIAVGPCGRAGGDCLFIAEIGDNNERHSHVAIFRVPEPAPGDTVTVEADRFRFTYPDGPRDAESLFVTSTGLFVVSKGRSSAIELYRLAPPYRTGQMPQIEPLQQIAPPPTSVSAQVTAAASLGDSLVVIRTYASLRFFRIAADSLIPIGRPADLTLVGERQGEGVDFISAHELVLTSESQGRDPATLSVIRCDPDRPPPDSMPADTTLPGDSVHGS